MEKTPREMFDERLRQAALEPDYSTPNTITRERLYILKEERGYDEYFDDFVEDLTKRMGDDPADFETPAELRAALANCKAATKK